MQNNFGLLLTALITAGSLGFINFFILKRLGVFTLRKSNEQDTKHFLLLFSLLNYVIYLLSFIYIKNRFINLEELLVIAISIVLTIVLTILLSLFIFPIIADGFNKTLNFLRKNKQLSEINHRGPRDIVFNNDKYQAVFIFDFNKTLISSGYLEHYSNESDYYEITLVPFDEEPYLNSYDRVKKFSESEADRDRDINILLDFEKKLQYFIIDESN